MAMSVVPANNTAHMCASHHIPPPPQTTFPQQDVDDSTSYTDWLTTPAGSLWLVMHGVGVFFLVLIMELVTGWGFLKLAGMIQGWRRTGRQGGGGARTRTPHAQRLVGHGD